MDKDLDRKKKLTQKPHSLAAPSSTQPGQLNPEFCLPRWPGRLDSRRKGFLLFVRLFPFKLPTIRHPCPTSPRSISYPLFFRSLKKSPSRMQIPINPIPLQPRLLQYLALLRRSLISISQAIIPHITPHSLLLIHLLELLARLLAVLLG